MKALDQSGSQGGSVAARRELISLSVHNLDPDKEDLQVIMAWGWRHHHHRPHRHHRNQRQNYHHQDGILANSP